jgi:hypothetical protein
MKVLKRDDRIGQLTQDLGKTVLNELPYQVTLVKTQSDHDALTKIKPKGTEEL